MEARAHAATVPMRYVRRIVQTAVARIDVPERRVLSWSGGTIDDSLLSDPRARVSVKEFSRLWGAVALRLNDECAGLAQFRVPVGGIETVCRASLTARTFPECAEVLARALNATLHDLIVRFSREGDQVAISFIEDRVERSFDHITYEVTILTAYALLAWIFGQRLPLSGVDFPFQVPRHLFELRALFNGKLRFEGDSATLRFAPECATLLAVRSVGDLPRVMRRAPGSFIEALLGRGQAEDAVRRVIYTALPRWLSVDTAAQALHVSTRSLHRKLALEGRSFNQIKSEVRRDLALDALIQTNRPLKRIASDLGFSSTASFQRAFVQWTGRTPRALRGRGASSD